LRPRCETKRARHPRVRRRCGRGAGAWWCGGVPKGKVDWLVDNARTAGTEASDHVPMPEIACSANASNSRIRRADARPRGRFALPSLAYPPIARWDQQSPPAPSLRILGIPICKSSNPFRHDQVFVAERVKLKSGRTTESAQQNVISRPTMTLQSRPTTGAHGGSAPSSSLSGPPTPQIFRVVCERKRSRI
jgi:hypothetical protein